jgi:hypothetical protein
MELFGFFVWTHHGWAKVLTVLSPQGGDAAHAYIETDDNIVVTGGDGRMPQYMEKTAGGLDSLIERYSIKVLDREAWEAKKRELAKPGER